MFRKGTFWVAFFLSLAISFCPAAKAGDNDQKEIKKIASAATHISKIKQVNVEILGNTAWVAVLGKILSKEVVAKPPLEFDALQDLVMTKTGDKWQIVAKNVDLLDFKEEPFYKDMPEVAKQAFEKFLYRATMMGTWIYFPTDTYEGRFIFLPDGTFTFTGWEYPKNDYCLCSEEYGIISLNNCLNGARRCSKKHSVLCNFKKGLALRKPVKSICFVCVGRRDFGVPAANMIRLISSVPAISTIVGPAVIKPL
jgi:hypothetical protein